MTQTTTATPLRAGAWTVRSDRTTVGFAVRDLGLTVRGRIPCTAGALTVEDAGRPVMLTAELALDGIDTGIRRRDADLRKPRFLDVDNHPTMTFRCTDFRETADGWAADGTLGVRGTSCPLTLSGSGEPDSTAGMLHLTATATLDRRATGLRAPRLLIGHQVRISIDTWLDAPR